MFQPDPATVVAWTSASLFRNRLRDPDMEQAKQAIARSNVCESRRIRSLALATGLAILLLVLALAILHTSPSTSAFAVVAALPVFRNLARSKRGIAASPGT